MTDEMSNVDTLAKRLRAFDHWSLEDCFCQSGLYTQAADRIEALTAEVDRLKDKVARQSEQITGLEASRRNLESLTAGAHRRVADVEAEVNRLREARVEIYWLREALTIIGNEAGLPVESYRNSLELAQAVASAALEGQQP